jgi:DNA polymerase III sliding clamp (beta) subunit (PCNA family)
MSTLTETGIATQYVVPLATAKSIASLINFASNEKITPALTVIRVVFDGDRMTATATDRYVVIQAQYAECPDNFNTGTVYLDAAAAKFIASQKVAKGYNPLITFDVDDDGLTIKANGASITIRQFSGNYPAVESLFESHKPAELAEVHHFRIELLAKLGKVVDVDGSKVESWNFEFGTRTKPERPVPVIATASLFKALIQPNLSRAS